MSIYEQQQQQQQQQKDVFTLVFHYLVIIDLFSLSLVLFSSS